MFGFLTRYFLRGLLIVAPTVVTVWVIWVVIVRVEALAVRAGLDQYKFPGTGLLVTLAVITLVGFLGSTFIVQWIMGIVNRVAGRLPFVKLLYTSIRDLIGAFVGDRKRFDQPVLVEVLPDCGGKALGFVTRKSMDQFGLLEHVAVYFPQSYNIAGNLIVLPRERVQRIEAESAALMAFIVSGGVAGESPGRLTGSVVGAGADAPGGKPGER